MKIAIVALLLLALFAGIVAGQRWYHDHTRLARNMRKYRIVEFYGCEGDCRNVPEVPKASDIFVVQCVRDLQIIPGDAYYVTIEFTDRFGIRERHKASTEFGPQILAATACED